MDPVYNNAALGTSAAAYKTRPSSKTHSASYSQQTPAMLMLSAQAWCPRGPKLLFRDPEGKPKFEGIIFFWEPPAKF